MDIQQVKNRFDIVGNAPDLGRAIEISVSVAPTDLTVLIIGESGVGKENFPKIIHQYSRRKNGKYFAVNCGAIPEGTIDSELFGHEKGSFTGANEMRKGYFEEADGGTLFLDEIGELPLSSQAKLLRVLQDGEFMRVGSSKVLKTDVRVVAATNVDLRHAVQRGKFREDLYYRLNAVTINIPPLRERKDDIPLLFRKFASDFAEKYSTPRINLTPDASELLKSYRWPGNVRQLKNVADTVCALESEAAISTGGRFEISSSVLSRYMPKDDSSLPSISVAGEGMSSSEKEALVRLIYQLRQEVDYLREKIDGGTPAGGSRAPQVGDKLPEYHEERQVDTREEAEWQDTEATSAGAEKDDLSIQKAGLQMIRKALERNNGNRKAAAGELGISERTLYRKIKELEDGQN